MNAPLNLTPATAPLHLDYTPAGDKSLAHRSALFAALAQGESTIRHYPISGVTTTLLNALTALNVQWHLTDGDTLHIVGRGLQGFTPPTAPLDCRNSATTIRLLAGAIAGAKIPAVLTGTPSLCRRPMQRIAEPLSQMGARIATTEGCAPLTLSPANTLHGMATTLSVASAQVKTCLILAALSADAPTSITEPGPSRDHTERMLTAMGATLATTRHPDGSFTHAIQPQRTPLVPLDISLPGDISSATFLLVAAAIVPGSTVTLHRVGINPTRTGILDALTQMGAAISRSNETMIAGEPVADITLTYTPLHGATFDGDLIVRMIDEIPALMIAALTADSPTHIRDAQELRHKESDRLAHMVTHLQAMGANVIEYPDGLTIIPAPLHGVTFDPHHDHRIAMSLTLASLIADTPSTLQDPQIITESFPDFLRVLTGTAAPSHS